MIDLLDKHNREIIKLCKQYNVRRLDVFGSATTAEFDPDRSDLDFIVEFENPDAPPGLLSRYLALAEELEHLLGRPVDLITPQSIRNPYFRETVENSREVLYAA